MSQPDKKNRLFLLIVDGLGLSPNWQANAFLTARPENFMSAWQNYPHTILKTDLAGNEKRDVNSKINHAVISTSDFDVSLTETIDKSIADSSFGSNEVLGSAILNIKQHYSKLHLVGTLGQSARDDNVDYLYALLKLARKKEVFNVYVHLVLEGSFSDRSEAVSLIEEIENKMAEIGTGQIASVSGQNNLNHIRSLNTLFRALVFGSGRNALSAEQAINLENGKHLDDLTPTVIISGGAPLAKISDFDSIILFDGQPGIFNKFASSFFEHTGIAESRRFPRFVRFTGLINVYDEEKSYFKVAFPHRFEHTLTEILAKADIKQIYISELSRAPHLITYFQGGISSALVKNIFIQTDLFAESYLRHYANISGQILNKLVESIQKPENDFFVVELPFLDIVSSLSTFNKTIEAVKIFDLLFAKIISLIGKLNIPLIVTSNYGRIENFQSIKTTNRNNPSTNPVPFLFIDSEKQRKNPAVNGFTSGLVADLLKSQNSLIDIAPTVLDLLKIDQPESMKGKSLLPNLVQPPEV